MPLVSWKQILKMDCHPLLQHSPPKKEFFGILSLRGKFFLFLCWVGVHWEFAKVLTMYKIYHT
jgi:hypothetical protein